MKKLPKKGSSDIDMSDIGMSDIAILGKSDGAAKSGVSKARSKIPSPKGDIAITAAKRKRAAAAAEILERLYPEALCSLEFQGDPWRLLVMGRLSAQCTDERVNIVCGGLFQRYPDVYAMAQGEIPEIEDIVRPCGLGHGKAVSIHDFSVIIAEKHGGRVPDTMEELLELPGVGRKIANLILGDVYGKGGIVADTHCIRICGRLGFYPGDKKDPLLTERVMEQLIPAEQCSAFCHRIVHFGREWCTARSPRCGECPMKDICPAAKQSGE